MWQFIQLEQINGKFPKSGQYRFKEGKTGLIKFETKEDAEAYAKNRWGESINGVYFYRVGLRNESGGYVEHSLTIYPFFLIWNPL